MRMGFRPRTVLVALTLIMLIVAHLASRWRQGGLEFQRRHALLAQRFESEAEIFRGEVETTSPNVTGRIELLREWLTDTEWKFRWHRRLAGSAYDRLVSTLAFQRRQAALAHACKLEILYTQQDLKLISPDGSGPMHGTPAESTSADVKDRVAKLRKHLKAAERSFLRHRQLAGPEYDRYYFKL